MKNIIISKTAWIKTQFKLLIMPNHELDFATDVYYQQKNISETLYIENKESEKVLDYFIVEQNLLSGSWMVFSKYKRLPYCHAYKSKFEAEKSCTIFNVKATKYFKTNEITLKLKE